MNSDHTTNRISDLLRLAGFKDKHTVEELTDHYLSHIENEVKLGVNSQQAVRETFQDIANLDSSQFKVKKNLPANRWILLCVFLLTTLGFFFLQSNSTKEKLNTPSNTPTPLALQINNEPPNGAPILQNTLDITSDFGMRMHPYTKSRKHHRGIDIRAKIGTPVIATGTGKVIETGFKKKPGKYIIIQHEEGFTTKFYHLSEIAVEENEEIKKGQIIGKVGNSGLSMMPHLHYEILKDEIPVNPKEYLEP
ncbi:MAG: M23 family metallopeptidase [Saprospiraceae bacterium]|nr:M23 family metallopeptidase [Saprospiraceae bacterium]